MTDRTRFSASSSSDLSTEEEWRDAHDFDAKDPMFGLTAKEMSGPVLGRRAVLRLMAAAGTLSSWTLLAGGGPVEAAEGKPGGTLQCGWPTLGQLETLDPAKMNQVLEFQITSNVLSGLVHIDNQLIAQADIAKDWTVSEDGLEYVFNLREGLTFHNGDAFDADDVLFTYNRSKDPGTSIHSRALFNVASLEKLGQYKVRFKLTQPQASFLVKTLERASGRAMTIVSRGALKTMGPDKYGLAPVGTGPFKITSHVLGQGVVLERFDKFYDPERPKLDKVVIKPIPDPEPLAAAMEAGDIQLISNYTVPAEIIGRFQKNPDFVVDIGAAPSYRAVFINPHRDPFKVSDFNKPLDELMKEKGFMVRLAIAKAMDRELFVKQALFGLGAPSYGSVNPAMAYYFDPDLAKTSGQRFDKAEAQRLLAEAGYPNGQGFPKLKLSSSPARRRAMLIVSGILKQNLNIDVEVVIKDDTVVLEEFLAMDFDLSDIGSGGDYDPDDALADWMQTTSLFNGPKRDKSKYPFGYFSDKEVDELIDTERAEGNLEKRRELVRRANKITSDKVASMFLFHSADVLIHSNKVNIPKVSRIPGLVDLDRATLA